MAAEWSYRIHKHREGKQCVWGTPRVGVALRTDRLRGDIQRGNTRSAGGFRGPSSIPLFPAGLKNNLSMVPLSPTGGHQVPSRRQVLSSSHQEKGREPMVQRQQLRTGGTHQGPRLLTQNTRGFRPWTRLGLRGPDPPALEDEILSPPERNPSQG